MTRLYSYVGPPEIANSINADSERVQITSANGARKWIETSGTSALIVTFIVDADGRLWIADRQSEHVACARGEPVLSAGEMTLETDPESVDVTWATNQSTGYCPKPDSWSAVAAALDNAGIGHAGDFDLRCEFRRCSCGQINIVKNNVFECGVCSSELHRDWNLAPEKPQNTD